MRSCTLSNLWCGSAACPNSIHSSGKATAVEGGSYATTPSKGGLKKRITDNLNIANAIHKWAPDTYKNEKALIYELDANQRFFENLYDASATLEQDWLSEDILSMKNGMARLVFSRVYRQIGMPPPPDSIVR